MRIINVDWKAIRPINGSRREGFEELCCQIADAERPKDTSFERKGTPDAGVECYATFKDGCEWVWQAKYFDTLGDSQWLQLDKSVKTALEKHPRIVRYYVCIPLDRSDARTEGRRSAKDRWNEHVSKWTSWARHRGINMDLMYWGSYELIERLSRPEYRGRLRFWFDVHGFDPGWFDARLSEAIKAAGPRYTPEIHVALPISEKFEAFGRTKEFFDSLKIRARPVREKLARLETVTVRKDAVLSAEPVCRGGSPSLDELTSQLVAVAKVIRRVLIGLGEHIDPIGLLPFNQLASEIDVALSNAGRLELTLRNFEKVADENKAIAEAEKASSSYHTNPFRDARHHLYELEQELRGFRDALQDADLFAGASLLILTGRAGTGKTHLLCDISHTRLRQGRPTVLLMGQRFLSRDDPWTQALQHLDLAHLSAEEFVGALDAAAQAAGCRAFVLIDALNEGSGRQIWPEHLHAFLAHLQRSEWISTVLTVRFSYEEIVIPEEIRERAARIEHHGFVDHEYDATRTFFDFYSIERPSTPLLVPEFQNPLFLKVLCRGLNENGQRRLPRGFHGISATFDLFLGGVNGRLADELEFNLKRPLVRGAVELLAGAFFEKSARWLPLEEAEDLVNTLLPGRVFERSLYRGLVSEGVIIEEGVWHESGTSEEIVQLAYERLSDYLVAKMTLDRHFDQENPEVAFGKEGPLTYLADSKEYIPAGLLEALCVQIPELTGKELPELLPEIERRRGFAESFRQSLIWREPNALSDVTHQVLARITKRWEDLHALLEVFVTLAIVPDHPLNAAYLHEKLSQKQMPDRDAGWSIFLHRAWGDRGAVERLVEWGWTLAPDVPIEDSSVDLCATALAWMLTTSNRFLRDRATKALVNLLTGRLSAAIRLVERFTNIDDPYVAERVYAVAYGCAMRSDDSEDVGRLGKVVYDLVFRDGSPPAHILLRDYARGVIERALCLGTRDDIDPERIRPPYPSTWPHIPTEEEIDPLKPDWSRGSHDSGDREWARNRIGSSVLSDDFARYVIGTNSGLSNWLSLGLNEPVWQSPDERLASLVENFSEKEKNAWTLYDTARRAFYISRLRVMVLFSEGREGEEADEMPADADDRLRELEHSIEHFKVRLFDAITPEHAKQLNEILADNDSDNHRPPYFDLRLIQRYILWRVFDFGWTKERFGHFDRHDAGYHGREASKAERIGKKYQWIAYHEIMAFVADHFQYRERFDRTEAHGSYQGPWQDYLRDIDPSCTLRKTPEGSLSDGHLPAWWGSPDYEHWTTVADHRAWVQRTEDLPSISRFLLASNPNDESTWVNLNGFQKWSQPTPLDHDPHEVGRREIWYMCHGYLLRTEHAEAFMEWAETVDFRGGWMPEPSDRYELFLGEHVWSPASRYFEHPYYGDQGWANPGHGCPCALRVGSFVYLKESSGFDCSTDGGYRLRLPSSDLLRSLGIQWRGTAGDYVDSEGTLIAFDPTAYSTGPTALLIRQEPLVRCLERDGLSLCWTLIGERRIIPAGMTPGYLNSLRLSGTYILGGNGRPSGFLKCVLEQGQNPEANLPESLLVTIRTSD